MFSFSDLSSFPVVGFSGSRVLQPEMTDALDFAAGWVSYSSSVYVGCARGVDAWVRGVWPEARVFSVSDVGFAGRGAFAARSIAFVDAVGAAGGLLISVPASGSLPVYGLVPSSSSSRCFCGGGSGSWASLAYAIGCGVPSLVFLGSGSSPASWGLSRVLNWPGWFFSDAPAGVQLSLF